MKREIGKIDWYGGRTREKYRNPCGYIALPSGDKLKFYTKDICLEDYFVGCSDYPTPDELDQLDELFSSEKAVTFEKQINSRMKTEAVRVRLLSEESDSYIIDFLVQCTMDKITETFFSKCISDMSIVALKKYIKVNNRILRLCDPQNQFNIIREDVSNLLQKWEHISNEAKILFIVTYLGKSQV